MVNLLKKASVEHNLLVYCALLLKRNSFGAIYSIPKKPILFP